MMIGPLTVQVHFISKVVYHIYIWPLKSMLGVLNKDKSDSCQVINDFVTMVQKQFQANTQVFRSDNDKEYFNIIYDDFFT
jgi:hypothetical protein